MLFLSEQKKGILMNSHKQTMAWGTVFMKILRAGHPCLPPMSEIETTKNETSTMDKLTQFDKNFNIEVKIWVGDVYLARFPNRIGSELAGDHFVIAVVNSNVDNPNVVVIPLTSLKEKNRNPANSLYLGYINGINNGKQSVALLNQVTCIDKKRLINDKDIDKSFEELKSKNFSENEVVCKIGKPHYRLTDSQLGKLLFASRVYFKRNSRKSWKKKLVEIQ